MLVVWIAMMSSSERNRLETLDRARQVHEDLHFRTSPYNIPIISN